MSSPESSFNSPRSQLLVILEGYSPTFITRTMFASFRYRNFVGASGLLSSYARLHVVDHGFILLNCLENEGELPDALGDLSCLVVLEMYQNEISGKCNLRTPNTHPCVECGGALPRNYHRCRKSEARLLENVPPVATVILASISNLVG